MKTNLDQLALDIEFLIISVIQGVALAALAGTAAKIIGDLQFEYWLYIISAFLLILNFWSQAIIHAVSFIDWPLDLSHNFLYFFASLIEVMAFSYMSSPAKWFAFMSVFFLIAILLYIIDMRLINDREEKFNTTKERKKLFVHIRKREKFEMNMYLPLAILFNFISVLLINLYPTFFIKNHYHILLIALQVLFALIYLVDSTHNFQKRSEFIKNSS